MYKCCGGCPRLSGYFGLCGLRRFSGLEFLPPSLDNGPLVLRIRPDQGCCIPRSLAYCGPPIGGHPMKRVVAIIQPFKLDEVEDAVIKLGFLALT